MSIKIIKPYSISPKIGHIFQLLHKTEPSLLNISRVERSAVCGTETLFALHSSGPKSSSSYFMQARAFINVIRHTEIETFAQCGRQTSNRH